MATLRLIRQPPFAHEVVELLGLPSDAASYDEFESYIRSTATPIYHPVGTCRMGSDMGAVVGADLRVRGVERLAVADASIMPRHISGNTHGTALMIGEKAADLLRGERRS